MYDNDRNIERCLSWLNDNLKLTDEEKNILSFLACKKHKMYEPIEKTTSKKYTKGRLTPKGKDYILRNYKRKTVAEMADELDMLSNKSIIRAFLTKQGLRAVSARGNKNNEKQS